MGAPLPFKTANTRRTHRSTGDGLLECGLVAQDSDGAIININPIHDRLGVSLTKADFAGVIFSCMARPNLSIASGSKAAG